ncbi:hypothetical protein L2E82_25467 [Cichorium intybus]|uniref:Uncharacterized protein n=1 Tax=Cichorium intybus TaxID=13427 RepID=A0ACB9E401_CICIN|nr:hypothetical protein L2E82_25467 [Cichorium intybus]
MGWKDSSRRNFDFIRFERLTNVKELELSSHGVKIRGATLVVNLSRHKRKNEMRYATDESRYAGLKGSHRTRFFPPPPPPPSPRSTRDRPGDQQTFVEVVGASGEGTDHNQFAKVVGAIGEGTYHNHHLLFLPQLYN